MTSKTNEYVIDAHAIIWYLSGSPRLGANAGMVLRDSASVLYLPLIALAEACWAVERGKTSIPSVSALLTDVDADPRITIIPLDRAILDRSLTLTGIGEMHDRQIAATALNLSTPKTQVVLLTCDANITASALVPVLW
jgi:PIN domain nuclease of toxin-antitoxin system